VQRQGDGRADFIAALDQLEEEKGVPKESILALVETSLVSAFVPVFPEVSNLHVRVDRQSGAIRAFALLRVVEVVQEPPAEVALAEASELLQRPAVVGETVEKPLELQDSGRIAAQAARHAVLQKIREAERDQVLKEVLEHKGEIQSGVIERTEAGFVYLDLGKAEGVLAPEEQIPGEAYPLSRRLKVLLLEAKRRSKTPQINVSRAHKNLVKRLLEFEVPELADGTVLIKALVREAGVRSKIAVTTRPERVDIVPWSEDPATFVAHALSPAQVVRVDIDRENKNATAHVPTTQLSLAIGKDGQNARLAAKLTGWRIDIKPLPVAAESEASPRR
jgi:N utilization substance protein A